MHSFTHSLKHSFTHPFTHTSCLFVFWFLADIGDETAIEAETAPAHMFPENVAFEVFNVAEDFPCKAEEDWGWHGASHATDDEPLLKPTFDVILWSVLRLCISSTSTHTRSLFHHSHTHLLIYTHTHSLLHSHIHTHTLTHSFTDSFTHSLALAALSLPFGQPECDQVRPPVLRR